MVNKTIHGKCGLIMLSMVFHMGQKFYYELDCIGQFDILESMKGTSYWMAPENVNEI